MSYEVKRRIGRKEKEVLLTLHSSGSMKLEELIIITLSKPEDVKSVVTELEREGLVSVSKGNVVSITEKGREVLEHEIDYMLKVLQSFIKSSYELPKPKLVELNAVSLDTARLTNALRLITSLHHPILHPKPPSLESLDKEFPKVLQPLEVPKTLLTKMQGLRPCLIELDKSVNLKPHIPLLKLVKLNTITPRLINMDKENHINVKQQMIQPPILNVSKPKLIDLDAVAIKLEEVADIFEALFEVEEVEEREIDLGSSMIIYDRPVLIVAIKRRDYDYVNTIRHMLRVLYRIAVGGLPRGEYLAQLGDSLEKSRLHYESFKEGVIRVIEIDEKNINDLNLDILRDRLRELLVEDLSYTILYIAEAIAERVINDFVNRYAGEFGAKKFVIKPRTLTVEQVKKLSALLWGYRNVPDNEMLPKSLDTAFTKLAEKYYNDLEQILNTATKMGYTFIVRPHSSAVGREAPEHYLLKVFTVYYFVEKEKVKLEDIRVEEPLPGCGGIIPDVFIASKGVAVEVETLYGEGLAWLNKLVQSVEKYKHCSVSEVWLVIPPLQASIFMKPLMSFAKWLNERRPISARVRILTVDLKEKEFIPVAKMGKLIRKVLRGESIHEEGHLKSLDNV
jgi:DNA-binding MarR family transcriptional regulator